ncbi:MAG: type I DNA topoisomerase [Negativicutes bacterium]|nr:type I DNA topoisomerase [Negativicutes bacterium]
MKNLLIVESPTKARTIEKYLGKDYQVRASMGHLRDLPKSRLAVDVDNGFVPEYVTIRGKAGLIRELRKLAGAADRVLLATDPDREGEAIAWQLAEILSLPADGCCRVEFNEITKGTVAAAISRPRPVDGGRVEAQQARRILDRLVGYRLSPLLWKKVRRGLSAGRVQSVAVRLICDREQERENFVVEEYWTIHAWLMTENGERLVAELSAIDRARPAIADQERAAAVCREIEQQEFWVGEVKEAVRRRNPLPPFITSSLQQDASRKLGFSGKRTMLIAQQLYEGLPIGQSGPVGLITYMRTDSTRVAESFQQEARQYIARTYGQDYLPARPPQYVKKQAQDAHEAIRPTTISLPPETVRPHLTADQYRVYQLIWQRFIASQMGAAVYDTVAAKLTAGRFGFKAGGSVLRFAGWLAVYSDEAEENDRPIPKLAAGQRLTCEGVEGKQHFTEPPPRFNEASLIKLLEEKGIGRPSTYATIISTIQDRGYVAMEDKRFYPTVLGRTVNDLLLDNFAEIVDVDFTATMEERLDLIAEGRDSRQVLLSEFYRRFAAEVERAERELPRVRMPEQVTGEICEKCGKNMVIRSGRFGEFLACPGWPECKNAKPLAVRVDAVCPLCGGQVLEKKGKNRKKFYSCANYPQCGFTSWGIPVADSQCPQCGSYLVRNPGRGRRKEVCGNSRCSDRMPAGVKKKTTGKRQPTGRKRPAATPAGRTAGKGQRRPAGTAGRTAAGKRKK